MPNRKSKGTIPALTQCQTMTVNKACLLNVDETYKIGNHDVFGCKPGDDAEITQCWHEKAREEVERK